MSNQAALICHKRYHRTAACLILISSLLVAIPLLDKHLIDDAYITFRYADNLVRHGQLVFNVGERIEGETNLFWALLLSFFRFFGAPIPQVSVVLSVLFYIACGVRCFQLLELTTTPWKALGLTLLLFPLGGTLVDLTYNGMETLLYAFLIFDAFWSLANRLYGRLGLVCGLAFATRPEGALVGFLFVIAASELRRPHIKHAAKTGVILIIFIATISAFRFSYYGSLIPNSIIAKSIPVELMISTWEWTTAPYLIGFFSYNPAFSAALIVFAALCLFQPPRPGSVFAIANTESTAAPERRLIISEVLAFFVIAMSFAVVIRNGGDWMPHWRLLVQYSACYILLARHVVRRCKPSVPFFLACALGGAILRIVSLEKQPCCSFAPEVIPSDFYEATAEALKGLVSPNDVVSSEAAGYLPFRLIDTTFHDPLGLMDKHLARNGVPGATFGKSDFNYTLGIVRPSFAVWHYSGHLLDVDPKWLSEYQYYCYRQCSDIMNALLVMVRKDRATVSTAAAFSSWQSGNQIAVLNKIGGRP